MGTPMASAYPDAGCGVDADHLAGRGSVRSETSLGSDSRRRSARAARHRPILPSAYDEIIATAIKRQHDPHVVAELLTSDIAEKQARSIKYQMTIAKLPLAKDIDDFSFAETGINETLVHDLADGNFLAHERNVVLIGGTGTGKTHLAIAIARACIRNGARGRFFNVVDLVNKLEAETRNGKQGRMAD